MKEIGMIGLGAMGRHIARNLIDGGYELTLYDVRPEAVEPFLLLGAKSAGSVQELGKVTDTVIIMVNTFDQCCSVLEELLQTFTGVIINLGTIAAEEARSLEETARKQGSRMIDCPVSGGTAGAQAGTLTLMAACEESLFARYEPLLRCIGSNLVHVGDEPGQGQALKSINQLLVGVHMCATAEAFTLAKQCGLDLQTVYQVICKSAGCSEIFRNRGQFLIDRDFSTRSTLQIQLKDTNIVCKTADQVGAPVLLADTARGLFELAVRKYPPTDDSIEVVRVYEELCNTTS